MQAGWLGAGLCGVPGKDWMHATPSVSYWQGVRGRGEGRACGAGRVRQGQGQGGRALGASQPTCPDPHALTLNAAGDIESYAAELSALLAARASALEALRLRLHRFRRLVSGLMGGAGGVQA